MTPHGFRLGRIFGIDIIADRSWLFIFLLVTWNLTVVFLGRHPTWAFVPSVVLATIASLLFFGSILVHELAHALVARRFRIPVRSITLFLFGGVSNIEREPPSPAAEFWMAIVGPLTSFGLGVGFLAAWILSGGAFSKTSGGVDLGALDPMSTLLLWLGPVNIVIGLFNLIPGFPLDGGRVFRALLWSLLGDLHKATRWAAAVGQIIGWTFVVAGVATLFGAHVPFVGSGPAAGLWFAFIGWFLTSAAHRSYQSLLVHDALEGVPVWRLMREVRAVVPDGGATVEEVARQRFVRSEERALPVFDEGRFVGILSISDLRRLPRPQWKRLSARDVMTPVRRLEIASPDMDLDVALRRLSDRGVHQLPVMDEGRLVGMLHVSDVARWVELHVQPPLEGHSAATH